MSRIIDGDGPLPARVLIIGQRPGYFEVRQGKPFVGKSGLELDRYLLQCCNLDRSSVRCTNLVRDFDGEDELTEEEIGRDWSALQDEIFQCQCSTIVLLGGYATKAFLGPSVSLDWAGGLRFPSTECAKDSAAYEWRSYVNEFMPITHVAAALHNQRETVRVWYGFTQLGKLLRGETLPTGHLQDNCPEPRYTLTERERVEYRCAVDTEGSVESPWCLSFSAREGRGFVSKSSLEFEDEVVLHNSLHDLSVLKAMGCKVRKFTDTMIAAALLGTEPLGLKSLARRHTGMIMDDYESVVAPVKRELSLEYLSKVLDRVG